MIAARDKLWPRHPEEGEQERREREEKERTERRRRAKERQQKLMEEFASRQKQFMQRTMETGKRNLLLHPHQPSAAFFCWPNFS